MDMSGYAPLVSCVITTHNRIDLLPRAIDSVLKQTYSNLECIVVSDNSSDGTVEYCQGRVGIRFINITLDESRGGNYARNVGIRSSNGEYVAFLDDDDYWLPTKIEKQVSLIDEKNCDLVYCGRSIESVGPDGSVSFFDTLPDRNNTGDMRKKVLLTIATTTTSAILLRKSALFDIGLFDENLKFWQEYEMLIRMAQRSPFYYVNEALIVYRVDRKDKNRLTNKYYEWLSTARYIRRKHIKLYRHLTLGEYKLYRLMFHDDAIARAETCGLPQEVEKHQNWIKFWKSPQIMRDKFIQLLR